MKVQRLKHINLETKEEWTSFFPSVLVHYEQCDWKMSDNVNGICVHFGEIEVYLTPRHYDAIHYVELINKNSLNMYIKEYINIQNHWEFMRDMKHNTCWQINFPPMSEGNRLLKEFEEKIIELLRLKTTKIFDTCKEINVDSDSDFVKKIRAKEIDCIIFDRGMKFFKLAEKTIKSRV